MMGLCRSPGHFSRQSRASPCRRADAFLGAIISWRSRPPADLLTGSLDGTTLDQQQPHFRLHWDSSPGVCIPGLAGVPSQALLQAHSLRNSIAVRRRSKRIEDGNYFNSQTNLKGGCGCVLPDERDLGL